MTIQSQSHFAPGLPGRLAMLAIAAGVGIVIGAGVVPRWGGDGRGGESTEARQSVPPRPVVFLSEDLIRAAEAQLDSVLGDGALFAFAALEWAAEHLPPNTSPGRGPGHPLP